MLITNQIEVPQPLESVWDFFSDIPQVAACLPGTNLTDQVGDDRYEGDVTIKAGPVKLEFAGSAEITARDEAEHEPRQCMGRRPHRRQCHSGQPRR